MNWQIFKPLENLFSRVFVRATLYSVLGMLAFTLTLIGINYTSQASKIKERFEQFAEQKAESVARLAAVDIHARRSEKVELLLNAVSDDLVIAAKAYNLSGREFASDQKSAQPLARVVINPDAALAASSGRVQTTIADTFLEYIVPARVNDRIVGSVLVRVSNSDFLALQEEVKTQILITLALVFALFVPTIAFLMHRVTAGISEITSAAKAASGGCLDIEDHLSAKSRGEVGHLQTEFRKMMSNTRASFEEIQRLVYSDPVTGLPNRTLLEKVASDYTDCTKASEGTMFYVGLDRFRLINDMHGYVVGDAVLRELAARLTEISTDLANKYQTKSPFVARFGGDEFVVIFPRKFEGEDIAALAKVFIERMGMPLMAEKLLFSVTVSIGYVYLSGKTGDSELITDVLQNANLAMHKAKCGGCVKYAGYTQDLRA